MAVKEKDNFENVKVTAKVPRKDKDGKRVKEVVDGRKVTVYDSVEKEIKHFMVYIRPRALDLLTECIDGFHS